MPRAGWRDREAAVVEKKELCKWKRDEYAREMPLLKRIVAEPGYVCEKCGRAADKKKRLCKPRKLKD
jgi:hypothetical protein